MVCAQVIHNHTVTWLAGWKDSINTKDWKYVQFGAQSSIKGESDLKKYEKARKLKDYVDAIRADYKRAWDSTDKKVRASPSCIRTRASRRSGALLPPPGS